VSERQPIDRRAQVIRAFTLLGGVYFFLYFILPETAAESLGIKARHEAISNGFIVIGAMAVGLGLFNLVSAHGSRIAFARKGWAYSLALLVGLFSMLAVTAAQWRQSLGITAEARKAQIVGEFAQRIVQDAESHAAAPALAVRAAALRAYADGLLDQIGATLLVGPPAETPLGIELRAAAASLRGSLPRLEAVPGESLSPEGKGALTDVGRAGELLSAALGAFLRQESSSTMVQQLYTLLYEGLFNQLGSAMFALLGVYIAAAAFRAFRIRTVESALMMAAALIVMLGQISLGQLISDELPAMRQWLLEVPNSAAFRAIRLGASVAALMLAIRMWLSIESGSFSSRKR